MAEYMTKLYQKYKIKRFDVLCHQNKIVPSNPKISIHDAGTGAALALKLKIKALKKNSFMKWGFRLLQGLMIGFGVFIIGITFFNIVTGWYGYDGWVYLLERPNGNFLGYFIDSLQANVMMIYLGMGALSMGAMLFIFKHIIGGLIGGKKGIGGAEAIDSPKLIIDNSQKTAPFVDACLLPETMVWLSPTFSNKYSAGSKCNPMIRGNRLHALHRRTDNFSKSWIYNELGDEQRIIKIEKKEWTGNVITIKPRLLPEVRVTENHPIKTANRGWVLAKDVKKDDVLIINIPNWTWFPPHKTSEDYAWLLGIYLAEGYCRREGPSGNGKKHGERWARELGFTLGFHERELAEKIKVLFKRYVDYDLKEDLHNPREIQLICYSAVHNRIFKEMFGKKSNEKHIPHEVFFWDDKAKRAFLRGYWEGDRIGPNTNGYSTSSKRLFYDLISLHLMLGEIPSTHIREVNGTFGKTIQHSMVINNKQKAHYKQDGNRLLLKVRYVKSEAYKGEIINLETEDGIVPLPFITHNTGHTSAQLYGSIAWDPYQTGGLGTPEHQRVSAGDVHRASMGIFYIDEIKNLAPLDAITLLSVMEDGCLPVAMRSQFHGADTAAMAVGTEPIPALFFLLAAGNFDSINQIHPALMDRLVGYGRVVRMNNDMKNNFRNRRKYVQFIAQEVSRFHLPPFSREACIEIINVGRRRSNKRDGLVTKFRPLISIIKTAGTLAQNEKSLVVKIVHVKKAINVHCKTIQKQLLEHAIQEKGKLLEIKPKGSKLGTIYGLAVIRDQFSGEMTGSVLRVKAQMVKKEKKKELIGYYNVTGIAKSKDGTTWMRDSAEKVRSAILRKYDVDIAQEYFTHIDFSQAYGVDGPSAGVTMALLLCSLLEGKPIRQDVAVTGEINISAEDEIEITAVGGVHEKIKAAEIWGFKKVVIPKKNFDYSIQESDYEIEVVGASNLTEYLKEMLIDD